MIISAINIWKKYGMTMNHGSGNYLNWYKLDREIVILDAYIISLF
jgi:hypothetical protein